MPRCRTGQRDPRATSSDAGAASVRDGRAIVAYRCRSTETMLARILRPTVPGRGANFSRKRVVGEAVARLVYRQGWAARVWERLPGRTEVDVIRHELALLPPGRGGGRCGSRLRPISTSGRSRRRGCSTTRLPAWRSWHLTCWCWGATTCTSRRPTPWRASWRPGGRRASGGQAWRSWATTICGRITIGSRTPSVGPAPRCSSTTPSACRRRSRTSRSSASTTSGPARPTRRARWRRPAMRR